MTSAILAHYYLHTYILSFYISWAKIKVAERESEDEAEIYFWFGSI